MHIFNKIPLSILKGTNLRVPPKLYKNISYQFLRFHEKKSSLMVYESKFFNTKPIMATNLIIENDVKKTRSFTLNYFVHGFHTSQSYNVLMPYLLADIGEGITECEIVQWFVQPGDHISEFDKLCEVQSDKASVEITSRYMGVVKNLHYKVGDMARVGNPIVDIEVEDVPEELHQSEELKDDTSLKSSDVISSSVTLTTIESISLKSPSLVKGDANKYLTLATPAVRRIARENNIDISNIKGTDKIIPLSHVQKSMFKTMTKSLKIPHFGYSDEYIMDNVINFRKSINEHISNNKNQYSFDKISFMPIFIKTFSAALRRFPILNSSLIDYEDDNMSNVKLKYRSSHNIGVAMDTPGGLLVPNIKNVQGKSILDIANELKRLQEAGKTNSIRPTDFQNGTITLSNIGIIGGTYLSPVIVSSEVCIVAIGKIQKLPRYENIRDGSSGGIHEKLVAKNVLTVSFSADHRVIDGATIARFSETWRNLLENPLLLSIELS
nr:15362_t:CDS:2 [Entrophospora candida]